MTWCIVRVERDWNYGQDGDKVLDVIGPFGNKDKAVTLAQTLQDKSWEGEEFQVHEMVSAVTSPSRY